MALAEPRKQVAMLPEIKATTLYFQPLHHLVAVVAQALKIELLRPSMVVQAAAPQGTAQVVERAELETLPV